MAVTLVRLVRIIALYFFASGLVFLFKAGVFRRYVSFWSRGIRLYLVSSVRLLTGLVLLAAAPHCRLGWFVAAFGVLNLVMGLPYFIRGIQGMKTMAGAWQKRPAAGVRLLGAGFLTAGVLLFYCAW